MLKGWPRKGVDTESRTLDSIRSIRAFTGAINLRRAFANCDRPPHRARLIPVVMSAPLALQGNVGGEVFPRVAHTLARLSPILKPPPLTTLIPRYFKLEAGKTFLAT